MNGLEKFQHTIARLLIALTFVHVVILGAIAWGLGAEPLTISLVAAVLAVAPVTTYMLGRPPHVTFLGIAVALVGQTSLLVFAMSGHPWQVEMHFYYFAVLAMLAGLCDATVLLTAATLIALHHLNLNYVLPSAVFPGGSDLGRVMVHAVIVVIETAMLLAIGRVIRNAFAVADSDRHKAEEAVSELARVGHQREDMLSRTTERAQQLGALLERFHKDILASVEVLHGASEELQTNADGLGRAATHANAQSVTASLASDETAGKVTAAAQAGDELAQTISEVGSNAEQSSHLAAQAVTETERTSAAIDELAAVASEIGQVTELISAIAGQTNLLALNATIEAARAGEAGRGFAVVAQEVKALAGQTAKATQEIGARIEAMQNATGRSVEAMHAISRTIRELDRYSARIASAVEQQAVAAREIAVSANSASQSVTRVNGAITEIDKVAGETSLAANRLTNAAGNIGNHTRKIRQQVEALTDDIHAMQASA